MITLSNLPADPEITLTKETWCECQPVQNSLDFLLPTELEAGEPPEARGLRRDQVRLMVSYVPSGRIIHTRFHQLADFLFPGDVLVINTSGTMNAALPAQRVDGSCLELHLSTHVSGNQWVVELRRIDKNASIPYYHGVSGERLSLPAGGKVKLLTPYRPGNRNGDSKGKQVRLWLASLELPVPVEIYLDQHGFPIHYSYVHKSWPLSYYQTVYTTEKGSAEMPSAGRAFTPELVTQLVANGILFAPLILHTGVASLEDHEPPYPEYYRIPPVSAQLINNAHQHGGRVIAVGTTSVRTLETAADEQGVVRPGEGWTDLIIMPEHRMRVVDSLLTGLHEPRSSHLAMLASLAGIEHLSCTYREALEEGYLWHEFGDLHLIFA